MENLLFTFTQKKNPSEFLVEQRVKSNEQRAKSNEQQAKSNEQRATSKKFHLIINLSVLILAEFFIYYKIFFMSLDNKEELTKTVKVCFYHILTESQFITVYISLIIYIFLVIISVRSFRHMI